MSNRRPPANRSIDAESRKPRVSTRKMFTKQPPQPKNESESDDYISENSDSELEKELNMPAKDDTKRKVLRSRTERNRHQKDTAEQSAVHSQQETETAEKSIQAAPHMIMRSANYHLRIAPITYPKVSTYVPSTYMYFFTLQSAHRIVHENTYLRYLSPQYLTVASKLYYGMLIYIQILRAKVVSGTITRPESQALRRFEREFPFESLPIMSPLIMFFQNLGAVKLADPMYSWICPTLPEVIGTGPNVNGIFARSQDVMLPNIPALIRFLFEIGTAQDINAITSNGVLAPASAVANSQNFFGIQLGENSQNQADTQRLIYSAGWLQPPELAESLDIKVARRIGRWNLPNLSAASDFRSIGQFLQTDGNMEWFASLVNMCTEEARFFKGSTNLSAIQPTSGLSSLIEVTYKSQKRPESISELYPFSHGRFDSSLWTYEATTTRGESVSDELQIGATTQFLVRNFGNLTPDQHATPQPDLDGPYFGQPAEGRQVNQIESDTTRSPRTAFEQIIRENLYDETGGKKL